MELSRFEGIYYIVSIKLRFILLFLLQQTFIRHLQKKFYQLFKTRGGGQFLEKGYKNGKIGIVGHPFFVER